MNIFKTALNRISKWAGVSSAQRLFFPRRQAGVVVNEDVALTYSAVWRSINLIAGSISILPWHVNQREVLASGGTKKKRLLTHPASALLDLVVNEEMSSMTFRETLTAHALTHGNGYAEIERDMANRPVALWMLSPERVDPARDENGHLVYKVKNNGRDDTILDSRDVFHLHGLGFDGLVGYSVIGYASKTIGLGLATEQCGATLFENGLMFNGILEHPGSLGDEAFKHLKESLNSEHKGVSNANKLLIIEEGMKWQARSIPPNDAQFLETRKFTVAEVGRWYGVPLHKLNEMDKSTFNNIEHQSIEFVTDALMPWIKRLETEANIKLISPANRLRIYTKINVNALLRGDTKSRGEWYQKMMNLGVYSINEVRALEDENPIENGDKRLVQLNLTTLDKVGEDPVTPALPDLPEEDEGDEEEETPQQRALDEALARVCSREQHRAVDALKRYTDDRAGLLMWMDKFFNEHRNYMLKNLATPLELAAPEIALDDFVDTHIASARITILTYFDEGTTYDQA